MREGALTLDNSDVKVPASNDRLLEVARHWADERHARYSVDYPVPTLALTGRAQHFDPHEPAQAPLLALWNPAIAPQ